MFASQRKEKLEYSNKSKYILEEPKDHFANTKLEDMAEGTVQNENTAQIYTLGIC